MNETLLQMVERRLQFLVMVTIFFPTILAAFYQFAGSTDGDIGKHMLEWGAMIGLGILNYFFFDIWKREIIERCLRVNNFLICSSIIGYVILIVSFSATVKEHPYIGWKAVVTTMGFMGSMYAVMYVPLAILLVFIVGKVIHWWNER